MSAEDAEEVAIAWLSGLRRASITRRTGDPLPFTLIRAVAGEETVEESRIDVVLSIRTLCDKANGEDAAMAESKKTHDRMLALARNLDPVALSDGRKAAVDYVRVFQHPLWVPYEDDQILVKLGRYSIGLTYVLAR